MAQVIHGDCLEVLKSLSDNSVDSIVTDPPAGIAFMGKSWDKDKGGRQQWIAWMSDVAAECLRVIKPGGHALVWAIPRTSHWTGTAWEDAGWECRDKIFHCFGSGFPKSLDVSKAIDLAAGAEREVVGEAIYADGKGRTTGANAGHIQQLKNMVGKSTQITAPATLSAKQWKGWGTALKPAVEEWWLFRKPLAEKTVAANVLEHGTGALNIDGCRVGTEKPRPLLTNEISASNLTGTGGANTYGSYAVRGSKAVGVTTQGRFPAHLIHDGSEEVLACFPETTSGARKEYDTPPTAHSVNFKIGCKKSFSCEGSQGSAARFFYCAKASKRDRNEGLDRNHHPTVKPIKLMRYLCRLITPPGETILDPFCGSGSTGKGAILEGFNFIGIEQDADYVEIAKARIAHVEPVKEPTLEERGQWLETQVKAQGNQIKKMQHQQLSLFG